MKIRSAEFISSATTLSRCPADALPEVALLGRSNVGKSSLINSFTNRKGLARTSKDPGRTRTMNFYLINREFRLVDLPGYGYANAPMKERASWERMVVGYLDGRKGLKGALVILDPRRDPSEADCLLYRLLKRLGIPYLTVFTKTDKLPAGRLGARLKAVKGAAPTGECVLFSSVTGEGRAALGKDIEAMLSGGEGGAEAMRTAQGAESTAKIPLDKL
jgi:GTP-binding protein